MAELRRKSSIILLVEDNPDDEELTRMALAESKILNKVVVAQDGPEALDYLLATGPYENRDRSFPKAAIPELLPALNNNNPLVRQRIARLLGRFGDPCAIEPLIFALKDKNLTVRNDVILALGAFNDARVVKALTGIMLTKVTGRDPVVEQVRESRSKPQAFAVMLAKDAEWKVDAITLRISAALSLGRIDTQQVVAPLLKAYQDKERWVREAAVKALGQMHTPQAGAALVPLDLPRWGKKRYTVVVVLA